MPSKGLDEGDLPAEETRPDPLRKASEILGFEPSRDSAVKNSSMNLSLVSPNQDDIIAEAKSVQICWIK